jgi:hypothetical protein
VLEPGTGTVRPQRPITVRALVNGINPGELVPNLRFKHRWPACQPHVLAKRADGRSRIDKEEHQWIEIVLSTVQVSNGKIIQGVAFFRDISFI